MGDISVTFWGKVALAAVSAGRSAEEASAIADAILAEATKRAEAETAKWNEAHGKIQESAPATGLAPQPASYNLMGIARGRSR